MGIVTMEGVQKLLHLDTTYDNFPTWEENLEFVVDGIHVKAVATHMWREEKVRIVEPFEVEGSVYLQGFRPPLICLGAAMLARRKSLAARGLTERDDCLRLAINTYRMEATYLRIKPEIDREQEEFLSVFRAELDELLNESIQAKERLRAGRLALRQQLHAQHLEQKQYAALLKPLQDEAEQCESRHYSLQFDVDCELTEIKMELIDRAIAEKVDQSQPLRLTGHNQLNESSSSL